MILSVSHVIKATSYKMEIVCLVLVIARHATMERRVVNAWEDTISMLLILHVILAQQVVRDVLPRTFVHPVVLDII